MWRIPTATSSALAAIRRQVNKAMDPTGVMARSICPGSTRQPSSGIRANLLTSAPRYWAVRSSSS